jgi:hypothetical protein
MLQRLTADSIASRFSMVEIPCLRFRCECGRDHSVDEADGQVTCDCGAVYAVTITKLWDPAGT